MSNVKNISPSTIETIDSAFLEYVENMNVFCTTINGWEKIPVIWASAERSYQIKNNKEIRDANGSLIAPIISIERASTSKDVNKKGGFYSNVSPKNDRYVLVSELNQDKTSNFANADSLKKVKQVNFITSKANKKQVYKYISIPIPIYVTVEYKIHIFTNYQSQTNEAVQPFMARTAQNYFVISKDGHRYECFMDQEFQQDSISNLGLEERKYKTVISVKVLGYLIGEGDNQEKPQTIEQENAVEIKFPRENVSLIQEEPQKQREAPSLIRNGGVQTSVTIPVKKVFTVGNGVDSVYIVTHNLNSRDLFISVRETSTPYSSIITSIVLDDLNFITLDFGTVIATNAYTVVILG